MPEMLENGLARCSSRKPESICRNGKRTMCYTSVQHNVWISTCSTTRLLISETPGQVGQSQGLDDRGGLEVWPPSVQSRRFITMPIAQDHKSASRLMGD